MVLTRNIFDDVKAAASFVLGERYTHPQANAVWAALRNIESGINIHNATTWLLDASALGFSGTPSLILVDEYLGNFVFFDDNAPTPGVRLFAFSGVDRTNTAITGLPTNAYPVVGAHDGAGVMVVGCTATGASTSKYARSANGAAWTVETSSTFTGSVPAALFYDRRAVRCWRRIHRDVIRRQRSVYGANGARGAVLCNVAFGSIERSWDIADPDHDADVVGYVRNKHRWRHVVH